MGYAADAVYKETNTRKELLGAWWNRQRWNTLSMVSPSWRGSWVLTSQLGEAGTAWQSAWGLREHRSRAHQI